jgi:hypothetical protein
VRWNVFLSTSFSEPRGEGPGSILASPGEHWSNFLNFFKEFRRACYPTRQRFQSGVSILRKQMATTIHSEITEIPAFHVPSVSLCGTIWFLSCTGFVLFTSYTCLGDRWFIKVDTTLGLSSMRHGVWTMCTQVFYFAHFSREYNTQNTPASAHFSHFSL